MRGFNWWPDEQPSDEIKEACWHKMEECGFVVDTVLSHTCPYKYIPREAFLPMINQDSVDDSTEKWLDNIESRLYYERWYCGHWHISKRVDKLHFLFHDVKYRGLAEVEGDFVELPSQLMENWAFDPEVLKQYAVHYRSNEVIPKYLVDKLRRSELFNQGFMATELIAASLSDMDIHSITEYEPFDPMAFERKALTEKRGLIPQIEPRYRYPYFSHIFDGGYSAGYYFYTWAEVLDKDAFEAFRESGDLFNKKIAGDFRRKILARGGSEDGMTMYRDFRGKDPDKRAMLRGRGLLNEPEPSGEDAAPAAETASAAREN